MYRKLDVETRTAALLADRNEANTHTASAQKHPGSSATYEYRTSEPKHCPHTQSLGEDHG